MNEQEKLQAIIDAYSAALLKASKAYRDWLKANPTTPVRISISVPDGIFLAATIQSAIEACFLVVDSNAHRMLAELALDWGRFRNGANFHDAKNNCRKRP